MEKKLMSAKEYNNQNIDGWYISEKLDGYRAYWNGNNLLTKNGNIINAPDYFIMNLPLTWHLDGELWLGHNLFENTGFIRSKKKNNPLWTAVKYIVFDIPNYMGTYVERYDFLRTLNLGSYAVVIKNFIFNEKTMNIDKILKQFEKEGAEGLMARNPKSSYEWGIRSNNLLKIKSFHDAEAIVIGYKMGTGKYNNVLGALYVKDVKNGVLFKIGSGFSDVLRKNYLKELPIGTVITYKYTDLTKYKKPRFPRFYRVREYLD